MGDGMLIELGVYKKECDKYLKMENEKSNYKIEI